MQPNQTQQPTLDPQVVNLTKAIRQTESGGDFTAKGASGEYGAYQFTVPTWDNLSKKYLGQAIPLQSATPEQQNEVAYKQVSDWKNAGLNVGQIASSWNAGAGEPNAYLGTFSNGKSSIGVNSYGVKYSVPDYAKSVATAYQTLKSGGQVGVDPNNPSSTAGTQIQQSNPSGAWFPSSETDSPIIAGLKTAGNLIPSAINFGKGILDVLNPLSTLSKVAQIPGAFNDAVQANGGSVSKTLANTAISLPGEVAKAAIPEAGRQLLRGDFTGAQQSITNDPVGQIAPFLLGAEGLAKGIDSTLGTNTAAGVDSAISNTAKVVTKPLASVTGGVGDLFGAVTKSAASHLTGLDSNTISQVLSSPEAFSKIEQDNISRGGLANEFGDNIDKIEQNLQETGAGYQPIRDMKGLAAVPESFIPDVLSKFGLKLENGEVTADTNSVTRNTSDIKAVQKFVDDWGQKTALTPNEFLNMRGDLSELANYDKLTGMGKTKSSQIIGDQLRQEANRAIRPQIPNLKELDTEYSPLINQFKQIKKDFLQSDGQGGYTFKDGAINKIANATGVGKENLLSRMDQVMPGIAKRIQILKAVEDIERAKGIKVGSYGKAVTEGIGFLSGGIPGAIVAAIITNPSIAVPLIRGLGWSAAKVGGLTATLRAIAGDVPKKSIVSPYVKPTAVIGATQENSTKR